MTLYIILVVLISFSAFFSASETAFSSVNLIRLKNLAANGNKRAEKAILVAEQFDYALSAILIGNNIVNIAAASIGTVICTDIFQENGVWISTLLMTTIVLIFGEILPKSLAKEHPEAFALLVAGVLRFKIKLFAPLIFFFVKIKRFVSKIFKSKDSEKPSVTEDELINIIEEIEEEGVLTEHESELVRSAIEFNDIVVDKVLTPRVDIIAVELEESVENVAKLFVESKFTRIPVYEKNIDKIVGILYEKDFFHELWEKETVNIVKTMKRPLFVSRKRNIADLMRELQRKKSHLAVVVDQYGGTLGIVTLEDILEELVGEIWDEDDDIVHNIRKVNENLWLVTADTNVEDFFNEINEKVPETSSTKIGGWALEIFEKIPKRNDSFIYKNLEIVVRELDDQRILKLRIKRS